MEDKKFVDRKQRKLNIEALRAKDNEKVKGIFRFYEVPGGTISFPFLKWKGDEVEIYTMTDGQMYTVPLMVAKHLNENCWYPEYGYLPGESGEMRAKDTGAFFGAGKRQAVKMRVRRMGFQSLEFMDIDGLNSPDSQIIEVTAAL